MYIHIHVHNVTYVIFRFIFFARHEFMVRAGRVRRTHGRARRVLYNIQTTVFYSYTIIPVAVIIFILVGDACKRGFCEWNDYPSRCTFPPAGFRTSQTRRREGQRTVVVKLLFVFRTFINTRFSGQQSFSEDGCHACSVALTSTRKHVEFRLLDFRVTSRKNDTKHHSFEEKPLEFYFF